METNEITKLVLNAKSDNEAMLKVIQRLYPLIHFYNRKLFFMEREDAEQEITLALIEAIKRIPRCQTDGECLMYLKNAAGFKYSYLCRKNIERQKYEEPYSDKCEMEIVFKEKGYHNMELKADWKIQFNKMSIKKQKIFTYLFLGYSDQEIAEKMGMSRQYINRIKKSWDKSD